MSAPTTQQLAAITARGNVLVAAGAGTGKTSTITARCLELVLKERCPLDAILMVTFTEAAAAEMRERIRKTLREAAEKAAPDSDDARWLAEQLALLDTAPISTLHSFCLDLARQNFHTLGLDPQFTVLDDPQTKPLIHTVLDELFQRHYANADSRNVRDFVQRYGNGRDDAIRKLVVKIHHYSQSLASPKQWLAKEVAAFSNPSTEAWRAVFVEGAIEWAQLWREALEPLTPGSSNVRQCAQALDVILRDRTFDSVAAAVATVLQAHEAPWNALKKDFRDPIKSFFADAKFLFDLSRDNGAPIAQDWKWSREPMLALLQLAREFTEDFTKAKREMGGIDFADQEQLALRLLWDERGNPSVVAQACRHKFQYVFVDECQDINAAQDAILRAVSREASGNRFLVGDVKQSIYRFRLANPRIFQEYESRWQSGLKQDETIAASNSTGQVLPLTENFRSREALLQFINPVFRELMRPVIGGLHYHAEAELKFGDPAGRAELSLRANLPPEEITPRVELHVITKESDSDAAMDFPDSDILLGDLPDLQATEREARLVALRFKQLKASGHRVWNRERNQLEPVEYRDMVVLLRSATGRAEIFAKAFHQAGVPLHAERAGFLTALEVTDLLNLLRLLDNPLQDVPLLAVLCSPLVGLAPDDLVRVRLAQRDGLLWFAVNEFAKGRDEIATRVKLFLQQWESWRELVRHSSLTHCLETALAATHYEALLLAGERGDARVANVRRLVELARRFDPFRREGLFRFLQFITEQEEAEVHHEPAVLNSENAVRLMTIHASKGLEFPVVALAGLGTRFNLRDLGNDILLSEEFGLCPKVLPPEMRRRYPSIVHWVAAQRERRALLGEEMRLLYVALTRARDTLILTGTAGKKEEITRWQKAFPVTNHALVKAQNILDWLRLWFTHAVVPENWSSEREGANALLRWKFDDPLDASFALHGDKAAEAQAEIKPPTEVEFVELRQLLARRYANAAATTEPAKTSVTVLRRRAEEVDAEAAPAFRFLRAGRGSGRRTSPGKLNAAEIGTAHHMFLQFVALDRTATELDLRNEAGRLREAGTLSADEVAALDFTALASFWQSDLGIRVRQQTTDTVHREMQFTARMSAADLRALQLPLMNPEVPDEEFVIIQGGADLVVLLPGEIWLLDFKTDQVKPEELDAKKKIYEPQLKLYAQALSRIYSRPVSECWLHFLGAGETVRIETGSKPAPEKKSSSKPAQMEFAL